jgi:hypothetical protein
MKFKIILLLTFFISNILLLSQFGGGSGTQSDPYQIWNKEHSIEFRDSISKSSWQGDKHFRLMQDIDSITQQLGFGYLSNFYGDGKTLTLYYEEGLPVVGTDGHILDSLTINSYFITKIPFGMSIGGGTLLHCINNANVIYYTSVGPYGPIDNPVSGIAVVNYGTISHCINNGSVIGVDKIGGIVAQNLGTISSCINTGKITASNSGSDNWGTGGIGGIVAESWNHISNCINLGDIIGQDNVGGILGMSWGSSSSQPLITNCTNAGYIKGTSKVGGIIGYINPYVIIINSVNVGVVEGNEDVGSIVGKE